MVETGHVAGSGWAGLASLRQGAGREVRPAICRTGRRDGRSARDDRCKRCGPGPRNRCRRRCRMGSRAGVSCPQSFWSCRMGHCPGERVASEKPEGSCRQACFIWSVVVGEVRLDRGGGGRAATVQAVTGQRSGCGVEGARLCPPWMLCPGVLCTVSRCAVYRVLCARLVHYSRTIPEDRHAGISLRQQSRKNALVPGVLAVPQSRGRRYKRG